MTERQVFVSRQKNCITILTASGKFSGKVIGDCFYRVFADCHILKYPKPALAIDCAIIDQLKQAGIVRLEFRHKTTNAVYRSTLAHFLEAAKPIDRGWGKQLALPLAGWVVAGKGVQPRGEAPAPKQLSLFGGVR